VGRLWSPVVQEDELSGEWWRAIHKRLEAKVHVIVNSDHNIDLSEATISEITGIVAPLLIRAATRLTSLEVQLSDGSAGGSTSNDIHCRVEAGSAGLDPQFTTASGDTVDQALRGALHTMVRH
jgi:hypothetical protein